jgi:hypothetical protein
MLCQQSGMVVFFDSETARKQECASRRSLIEIGGRCAIRLGEQQPKTRYENRTWATLRVIVSCEKERFCCSIDGSDLETTDYYPSHLLSKESLQCLACRRVVFSDV